MKIGCLIIHGFTGGPEEVEPLARYLKHHTNWDIVVPLLPGHGEELMFDNMSYKAWISTMEIVYRTLKEQYDIVYVIGFSMGGMIASYLAGKWKANKLVLLAPALKYLSLKQYTLDVVETMGDLFGGKIKENPLYLRYKKKVPWKAKIEFMKLVQHTKVYLKQITSPVFIAQGQSDGVVPVRTIYALDNQIASKQKEIVLFGQSDHHICLGADKDALNRMVYQFLYNPSKDKLSILS